LTVALISVRQTRSFDRVFASASDAKSLNLFNREFESLSSDGRSPDQTAGGAPPLGLGRGECGARFKRRTPVGE
jgi:hypothetical protein